MNEMLSLLRGMEWAVERIANDAHAGCIAASYPPPNNAESNAAAELEQATTALQKAHELALDLAEEFYNEYCTPDTSEMGAYDDKA